MTPLDTAIYWIKERESIRIKKERGDPPPWTRDPILRTYRFCNVRREDDRVTKWIDQHIRKPYADHELLWFMLCIARMINWPDTLSDLKCTRISDGEGWPDDPAFSPTTMGDVLEGRARRGEKVFTGAYIIPTPALGEKKPRWLAEHVLGQLWRARDQFKQHFSGSPTLRGTYSLLINFDRWGPFLSYQAIIDMRHTRLLKNAEDKEWWCAAGPGTIRGLNRLAGRAVNYPLKQDKARQELVYIKLIIQETGMNFELYEITGIMCELDKYLRVKVDGGRLRATYNPPKSLVQGSFL